MNFNKPARSVDNLSLWWAIWRWSRKKWEILELSWVKWVRKYF